MELKQILTIDKKFSSWFFILANKKLSKIRCIYTLLQYNRQRWFAATPLITYHFEARDLDIQFVSHNIYISSRNSVLLRRDFNISQNKLYIWNLQIMCFKMIYILLYLFNTFHPYKLMCFCYKSLNFFELPNLA